MSDTEDAEEVLSRKHKKERKDLQAQIQKLKHSVPKGDKKKKKEVTEQIAKLEHDLDERQEAESQELKATTVEVSNVAERLETLDTTDADSTSDNTGGSLCAASGQKVSKAQKRRNKKTAKDREREEEIKQQDVQNLSGARHIELQKVKEALKCQNLQIFEIKSDGNCLYNAVNHQLTKIGKGSSNEALRDQVAKYMKENGDDFLPFLTKDNGDLFTEDDFEKYCHDTAHTTTWGGQLEVRALSQTLKQPIRVVQSEGPPVVDGEQFEDQPSIVVCYLRHAFGLGEHYNSVEDYKPDNDEEFS